MTAKYEETLAGSEKPVVEIEQRSRRRSETLRALAPIVIALIPGAIAIWQGILLSEQAEESRRQTVELSRAQRITTISGALREVEKAVFNAIYREFGLPLSEVIHVDEFRQRCGVDGTSEHSAVSELILILKPYVGLISELYLLEMRVLDPLSGTQSEEWISQNGEMLSGDLYWFSYQMREIMDAVAYCRPEMGGYGNPLLRLMYWNIDEFGGFGLGAELKYGLTATEYKFRYDIAANYLALQSASTTQAGITTTVELSVENTGPRIFNYVDIRCLVSTRIVDLDSDVRRISSLMPNETRELTLQFSHPRPRNDEEVIHRCTIHRLEYSQGPVTSHDFFPSR